MGLQGAIHSDMASEQRALQRRPPEEVGFYLVASNRELLHHVETLMNRQGVFGVLDSSGRVHYLVDARKGSPLAARNIMTTAEGIARRRSLGLRNEKRRIRVAVDQVLGGYELNRQLRGYRLLSEILRVTATDQTLLNPVSKRLYPEIARQQGLRPHQVERNVRYLLDDLAARERTRPPGDRKLLRGPNQESLPVGRTISRLSEEVQRVLEALEDDDFEEMD